MSAAVALGVGCADGLDPGATDDPSVVDDVVFRGVNVRSYDRSLPDVDAVGYEIDVAVDDRNPGRETFRAAVRGTFVATRSLTQLTLDLEGNELDGVEVEGRAVTAQRRDGTLTVPLGAAVRAGRGLRVTVRYHGLLGQADSVNPNDFRAYGGLMVRQRNRAGRRIFASLNWPSKARRWLAVRDHPRDPALVAWSVTFDRRWTVVANGAQERVTDNPDGTRSWSFASTVPMPTYDLHVAAYDDWVETRGTTPQRGTAVRWLTYSRDARASMELYRGASEAVDFFSSRFGAYAWGTMAWVEAPIFGGGMEHATVVSMDETLFDDPATSRATAIHELAHHWSGNLVPLGSWNDFWLSEGFTEYLTARFIEAHDGPEAGRAHWRGYLSEALGEELRGTPHPLRPADPEGDVLSIFDAISYQKGALVLRMLEQRVGAEPFTRFLRGWFERHRGRATTTRALETELSAAFPSAGVPGFFAQWVHGSYHPELQVTTRYDAAARSATVTVAQTQRQGPREGFALPLTLEFSRGDQRGRATVPLTGRSTTATVPLAFDPSTVTVDPDESAFLAVACGPDRCRAGYTCQRALCIPSRP
ncbi:MAG: hypothetical protein HY909_14415 [Deltaproteobacteria bacterium]|nr:hypothetical protein [Deltaproteobacteria bacterium]